MDRDDDSPMTGSASASTTTTTSMAGVWRRGRREGDDDDGRSYPLNPGGSTGTVNPSIRHGHVNVGAKRNRTTIEDRGGGGSGSVSGRISSRDDGSLRRRRRRRRPRHVEEEEPPEDMLQQPPHAITSIIPSLLHLREMGLAPSWGGHGQRCSLTTVLRRRRCPPMAPTPALPRDRLSLWRDMLLRGGRHRLDPPPPADILPSPPRGTAGGVEADADADGAARARASVRSLLRGRMVRNYKAAVAAHVENQRRWRPYAVRSLTFADLCTPSSDAVLGFADGTGSNVLAVGPGIGPAVDGVVEGGHFFTSGEESSSSRPKRTRHASRMAIRFYAIPSPEEVLLRRRRRRRDSKTLLGGQHTATSNPILTVPLVVYSSPSDDVVPVDPSSDFGDGNNYNDDHNHYSVTNRRVDILTTSDSMLGVAFVRPLPRRRRRRRPPPLREVRVGGGVVVGEEESDEGDDDDGELDRDEDEDNLGTVVIFPLPGAAAGSSSVVASDPSAAERAAVGVGQEGAAGWSTEDRSTMTTSYQCTNVRVVGGEGDYDDHDSSTTKMRNLLWPTSTVPTLVPLERRPCSCTCGPRRDHRRRPLEEAAEGRRPPLAALPFSGYLLFNDEEDGYRMTWIDFFAPPSGRGGASPRPGGAEEVGHGGRFRHRPRLEVIAVPDEDEESVWERIETTTTTTVVGDGEAGGGGGSRPSCGVVSVSAATIEPGWKDHHDGPPRRLLRVPFVAYLRVDALLADVVARRPRLLRIPPTAGDGGCATPPSLPDFHYDLTSVSDGGRTINLILVFATGKNVDITGASNAGSSAPSRSPTLGAKPRPRPAPAALGVFVRVDAFDGSYEEMGWVQHPTWFDGDFLRRWSRSLSRGRRMSETLGSPKTHRPGGGGGSSNDDDAQLTDVGSLYPFCDHTGNRAVTDVTPVPVLRCGSCPIEVKYYDV